LTNNVYLSGANHCVNDVFRAVLSIYASFILDRFTTYNQYKGFLLIGNKIQIILNVVNISV